MQVEARTLFRSSTLRIVDWCCLGHRPEPYGSEEWNEVPEAVVVRRGAFVRRSEGREVFIDAGTVAFYDAEQSYRVRHPLGGDACSAFRLAPEAAGTLTGPIEPGALPRQDRFAAPSAPLAGHPFLWHRLALRAARDPSTLPLEVEELALAFLRAVLASAARPAPGQRPARMTTLATEYAARAREVVARRYRERLTLADIAVEVGCSPFHLHRLVSASLGVPLHRLIMRLRLRDALERLLETRDTVSAVAYASGFASHSHLTDLFRREYGCPPRAVRGLAARDVRPWLRPSGS